MGQKYTKTTGRSRRKPRQPQGRSEGIEDGAIQLTLPIAEIMAGTHSALDRLMGDVGLLVIRTLLEEEAETLAGKRGAHDKATAVRWGEAAGFVSLAGRKVPMDRPRVRSRDGQEIPLERYGLFQDERLEAVVEQRVVRGVSTRDYEGVLDAVCDGYGVRKSSVSRRWQAASAKQMKALMERPLGEIDLAVLMIDGVVFREETLVVALGVDTGGNKHVLGLWDGASENAGVCTALLNDLVDRGLDPGGPYLFVLDGSKAVRRAVRNVFGDEARVHRCHIHKERNILDHLPKRYHAMARRRLRVAWGMTRYDQATAELRKVVKYLGDLSASAAASLEEAFEETLTLHRLEVPTQLRKTLSSTNLIENVISRMRDLCANVKRWRPGMARRWAGTMFIEAEKGFRRIKGYRQLPGLVNALNEAETMQQAKA